MNKVQSKGKFFTVILAITLSLASSIVSAKLLISPTRVVFNERDRIQEIILINPTDALRTYRLSWEEKVADPEGGYLKEFDSSMVTASGQQFLRFSPRQVSLRPGERQIIKVMLRRKSNMQEAEYRSHLLFTVIPTEDESAEGFEPNDGIGLNLNLFVNYSLPVIIRTKAPDARVNIVDSRLSVIDGVPHVELDINRSGSSSFFGKLRLFQTDSKGEPVVVARRNHIHFFPEHMLYKRIIALNEDFDPSMGPILVELNGEKEFTNVEQQDYVVKY